MTRKDPGAPKSISISRHRSSPDALRWLRRRAAAARAPSAAPEPSVQGAWQSGSQLRKQDREEGAQQARRGASPALARARARSPAGLLYITYSWAAPLGEGRRYGNGARGFQSEEGKSKCVLR